MQTIKLVSYTVSLDSLCLDQQIKKQFWKVSWQRLQQQT